MPFVPMGARAVMLRPAELVTVLNALRNRVHDDVVPVTQAELELYHALRPIAEALGLRQGGNGWWMEAKEVAA